MASLVPSSGDVEVRRTNSRVWCVKVEPGQARSGRVKLGQVRPGQARSGRITVEDRYLQQQHKNHGNEQLTRSISGPKMSSFKSSDREGLEAAAAATPGAHHSLDETNCIGINVEVREARERIH